MAIIQCRDSCKSIQKMSTEAGEFNEMLQRARLGDQTAMARLVEQYEPEVRIVARVRLGGPLRPYLDSVDLVQSVHRSLMMGLRNDRFDISSPEKLVALAMTIVRRKIARHWRKLQRQSRLSGVVTPDELPNVMAALASPAADAEIQTDVTDQLQQLFHRLDEKEQRIIMLRFEGHRTAEVAKMIGMEPDHLRVKLLRLRRRIKDLNVWADWI